MTEPEPNEGIDTPIYWFTTLDIALERGDLETAGKAVRKLRAMGIIVRVPRVFTAESNVGEETKQCKR